MKELVRYCNRFKGKFKVPYLYRLIRNAELNLQIAAKPAFSTAEREIDFPFARQNSFAHLWIGVICIAMIYNLQSFK